MKSWFAVHTRAHGEQRALVNLDRQGFAPWLPLYRRERRHAGKVEQVLRPLFPRYLFVSLDPEAQRWRAILSTYGVAGLVGRADGPVAVPAPVIDGLRKRAGADGTFLLDRTSLLKTGDAVRIDAGPMRALLWAALPAAAYLGVYVLVGRAYARRGQRAPAGVLSVFGWVVLGLYLIGLKPMLF